MRLRFLAAVAALSLSSGLAFADSPTGAGVSGGVKAAGGVIAAGGGAGAIVAVTKLFSSGSKGEAFSITKAPEISTSGATAGLVLLAGGVLVLRGRKRFQDLAQ